MSSKKNLVSPSRRQKSVKPRRQPATPKTRRPLSKPRQRQQTAQKRTAAPVATLEATALHQSWWKKHQRLLALLLLVISLQTVFGSIWYMLYRRTILSFQVTPVVESNVVRIQPTRLKLPKQAIDLPVVPAYIRDGIWDVSDTSVSHLASSAYPGERSNMVMYGHNKSKILAKLRDVKLGDEIVVETDNGEVHRYWVKEVAVVKPTEIEMVLPTEQEVLTLYTCTGWLDSQRLVVKARPE